MIHPDPSTAHAVVYFGFLVLIGAPFVWLKWTASRLIRTGRRRVLYKRMLACTALSTVAFVSWMGIERQFWPGQPYPTPSWLKRASA